MPNQKAVKKKTKEKLNMRKWYEEWGEAKIKIKIKK